MSQGEIQTGQTLGLGREDQRRRAEAAPQGGLGTSGQISAVRAMALPTGAGSGKA